MSNINQQSPATVESNKANVSIVSVEQMTYDTDEGSTQKNKNVHMSASDFGPAKELKGDAEDFGDKPAKSSTATGEKVEQVKGQAKEKASQAADKAADMKDQAASKANEMKGQAKEKASEMSDKAADAKDQASAKANELKGQAKQKANEASESADNEETSSSSTSSTAANVKGQVAAGLNAAKVKGQEVASAAMASVQPQVERAKQMAGQVKDAVNEKVSQLTGRKSSTDTTATESTADKAEDVKNQASAKADEMKGQAKEKAAEMSDKAADMKDQAASKANELKGQAQQKASEVADKAADMKNQAQAKVEAEGGIMNTITSLKDQAATLASQALEKGKEYVAGVTGGKSESGLTEETHVDVPNDGKEHKIKQIYTMTEKEVGTDKDGHPIIEKSERWEEQLDQSTPKVVKSHSDKYTKA